MDADMEPIINDHSSLCAVEQPRGLDSDAKISALFNLVKQHPYLYDPRDTRHKDVFLVQQTWVNIAKELELEDPTGAGVELLKRKWKNKKDAYLKVTRAKLQRGTPVSMKGYRWAKHMSFLDEIFRAKRNMEAEETTSGQVSNGVDGDSSMLNTTNDSTFPESETDGSELKYTLSNKFSAQLLALVKEHPYLYDARDERYKDAQLTNNTWREIARKLGLKHPDTRGMTLCRKKWRNKRDACLKICRSRSWGSLNRYRWARHIGFLKDYIAETRPHLGSSSATVSGVEVDGVYQLQAEDTELDDLSDLSLPGVPDADISTTAHAPLSSEVNDRKSGLLIRSSAEGTMPTSQNPSLVELVNFSGQPVETSIEPVRQQDSNELFLMSCLQPLQRLDEDINAQARIEILQILHNKMVEQNTRRLQQQ